MNSNCNEAIYENNSPYCRIQSSLVYYTSQKEKVGRFVIFGGETYNALNLHRKLFKDLWLLESEYRYDEPSGQWNWLQIEENLDDLEAIWPQARSEHSAVVINDEMLILGGNIVSISLYTSTELFAYSFAKQSWCLLNDQFPPLAGHAAVAHGQKMFIYNNQAVSGEYILLEYDRVSNQVQSYDAADSNILSASYSAVTLHQQQFIYVFAGIIMQTQSISNAMWKVDINDLTNRQQLLQPNDCPISDITLNYYCDLNRIDKPCCRYGHSLVSLEGALLLYGGGSIDKYGQYISLNDLWRYKVESNSWLRLQQSDCTREGAPCLQHHKALAVEGATVIFAGRSFSGSAMQYSNQLWLYAQQPSLVPNDPPQFSSTEGNSLITVNTRHTENRTLQIYLLLPELIKDNSNRTNFHMKQQLFLCSLARITVHQADQEQVGCLSAAGVGANIKGILAAYSFSYIYSEAALLFHYNIPYIRSIHYDSASVRGTNTLTIICNELGPFHFRSYVQVLVGAKQCSDLTRKAVNVLECIIPPGSGRSNPVRIGALDQFSSSFNRFFVDYNPPAIAAISYNNSQLQRNISGVFLTIIGKDFAAANDLAVIIGEDKNYKCEPVQLISAEQLQCQIPAGAGKDLAVFVTVNQQSSIFSSNSSVQDVWFSYPKPQIHSIFPAVISTSGGEKLTIRGEFLGIYTDLIQILISDQDTALCDNIQWLAIGKSLTCITSEFHTESLALVTLLAANQLSDPAPLAVQFPSINSYLQVSLYTLVGLFLLALLALMYFLYRHRSQRLFRAASPLFCSIALLGSLLGLISCFFLPFSNFPSDSVIVLSSGVSNLHVSLWLLAVSFTLSLGPIVLKNYRLYIVFSHAKQMKRSMITNKKLLLYLLTLLGVDFALLVAVEICLHHCSLSANCSSMLFQCPGICPLFTLLAGFKCLFCLVGIYIAFQLRHVNDSAYCERHSLGYAIYAVSVALFLLCPLIILLRSWLRNLQFVLCILVIVAVYAGCSGCLLVPKILLIVKYGDSAGKSSAWDNKLHTRTNAMRTSQSRRDQGINTNFASPQLGIPTANNSINKASTVSNTRNSASILRRNSSSLFRWLDRQKSGLNSVELVQTATNSSANLPVTAISSNWAQTLPAQLHGRRSSLRSIDQLFMTKRGSANTLYDIREDPNSPLPPLIPFDSS
jgi:hypothetical protein